MKVLTWNLPVLLWVMKSFVWSLGGPVSSTRIHATEIANSLLCALSKISEPSQLLTYFVCSNQKMLCYRNLKQHSTPKHFLSRICIITKYSQSWHNALKTNAYFWGLSFDICPLSNPGSLLDVNYLCMGFSLKWRKYKSLP
jgi:hypothetical protein